MKSKLLKVEKGITLTVLVITIIVLLILAGAAINFTIGDEGIFTRTIDAQDRYKAEEIIEKMQITKGNTYIDKVGKFDIDDFLNNLVEEGIVGDREEIIDNGDGSYTITTDDGYIIDIIEKDEGKDVDIIYVGKGDKVGPRIKEIHVRNKTTNAIEIEVEASNANGAKYTYSYKKEDEEEYKEAATKIAENTYKYEKLEANKIYDLKVEVENKGIKKEKVINVTTGTLPEGAISIGEVVWESGKAKVEVNINKEIEGNLKLEYKINEEGNWIEIQDGEIIENLEHNQTIYARLTDGINAGEYATASVKDTTKPTVSIKTGTIKSNSIQVTVTASDVQTGLATSNTYEYFLNGTSKGKSTSNSYTYSNLADGTKYTLKVKVLDKAGNSNEASTTGTTSTVPSGTVSGAITFTSPTWTNGTASIKVSTNTSYQIEYQKNGTTGTWTKIASGGTISGLSHNTTVYARLTDGKNSGNHASSSIKDTTKPSKVTVNTNGYTSGAWTKANITLNLSATDKETGFQKYQVSINNTTSWKDCSSPYKITSDTNSTLYFRAVDKAGNVGDASNAIQVKRDATAPNSFNISINNVIYDGFTINASTSDATSGINRYEYMVNGSKKYSGTAKSYKATGLQKGVDYEVYVNAYDNAGNVRKSNVLRQRVKSKWTTKVSNSSAGKVTLNDPASEQNPTVLSILQYEDEMLYSYIRFNEKVKAGSKVAITYKYTRSSNNYYFNFDINTSKNERCIYLVSSGKDTKKTLTETLSYDGDFLELRVTKTDITSKNYYLDFYIYEVTLDGKKIL